MEEIRVSPVFQVGLKKPLLLDCERELISVVILILGTMVYANPGVFTVSLSGISWIIALSLLRKLAKIDPYMSKIYMKHVRYKKFYAPRSTPFCASTRIYN